MNPTKEKELIADNTRIMYAYIENEGMSYEQAAKKVKGSIKYSTLKNGFYEPQYKYIDNQRIKIGEKPNYNEYAEFIKEKYNAKADDSFCYIYNGKYYEQATHTKLDNICVEHTKHKVLPSQLKQFRQYVYAICYKRSDELKPPQSKINMNNGVLNIKTGKLEAHSSDYFFQYCLEHNFDPNATCPNFQDFLNYVFGTKSMLPLLTFEIFGYCLLGGDPKMHRAFLLFGEGRNGKSTWLDVLRELLGYQNTSAISMKLLGKPFSMVQLDGKLANIVEESPAEIDPEDFKNIVGGGMVTASQKFKNEYQLKINSRLFFATNKMPRFNDATTGIQDRLVIIPFKKYIKANERDTNIKEKLMKEIPGIINMSLYGLNDLIERGFKFKELSEIKETLEEYLNDSDSVHMWSNEYLHYTSSEEKFVITEVIFKNYFDHCKEFNIRPVGIREFQHRISKVFTRILASKGIEFDRQTHGRKQIDASRRYGCKYVENYKA